MTHVDNYEPGFDPMVDAVVRNLRQVYDPEIFTNVYDLGLIYDIKRMGERITEFGVNLEITMTLTSAFCPEADQLVEQVKEAAETVIGRDLVKVDVTFEPQWSPEMIPMHTKLEMGML